MRVASGEIRVEEKGYTKELGDLNRRFGKLLYRAVVGTITEAERTELDRLAVETPAMLRQVSKG